MRLGYLFFRSSKSIRRSNLGSQARHPDAVLKLIPAPINRARNQYHVKRHAFDSSTRTIEIRAHQYAIRHPKRRSVNLSPSQAKRICASCGLVRATERRANRPCLCHIEVAASVLSDYLTSALDTHVREASPKQIPFIFLETG